MKANSNVSDLGFGHLGNGITVWDRTREKDADYMKVAHISPERKVEFYTDEISEEQREAIKSFAKNEDPQTSTSQPENKVFRTRPV